MAGDNESQANRSLVGICISAFAGMAFSAFLGMWWIAIRGEYAAKMGVGMAYFAHAVISAFFVVAAIPGVALGLWFTRNRTSRSHHLVPWMIACGCVSITLVHVGWRLGNGLWRDGGVTAEVIYLVLGPSIIAALVILLGPMLRHLAWGLWSALGGRR